MSQSQLNTLSAYLDLMHTNALIHAFRAAIQLGVFDAMAQGPSESAEIAARAGLDADALELLLETLRSIGVVERYGDDFALAQVMHVLPSEFRDLGDRYWQHLAEFVRTGQSIPENEALDLDEVDFHVEAASSEWMHTPAAIEFVRVLDIGASRSGLKVLDLRCGSAVWSLTVAHRDPQARVTAVDTPDRLAAGQKHAQAIGVADRFEFIEGDFRSIDLPAGPFDLVILANVAHLEPADSLVPLLRRVAAVLAPEGEVAIVDIFPGQENGDRHRRVYQLGLALRTSAGAIHAPETLQDAVLEAGFDKPQFAHLPALPYALGLMLAVRSDSGSTSP